MKKFMMLFLGALLLPMAALAYNLKVTNLDKVAQTVQINNGGEIHDYTLQPWDVIQVNGTAMKLRLKDTRKKNSDVWGIDIRHGAGEFTTRFGDEYVIWPGGKLSLQRYGQVNRVN